MSLVFGSAIPAEDMRAGAYHAGHDHDPRNRCWRISDSSEEAGVINARYVSSGSVRSNGGIGSGRARGDTSNGFPGDYRVQYFDAAGELTGDLDLRIQRAGASYRLTWWHRSQNVSLPAAVGVTVYEGIGCPNGERSMAIAYWMAERVSAAIEGRPLL
ncbi:hypothetical protein [Mycobacterium ostraviense]|uniref:hypothetical protein n=1 Tax=Mycobacterium ostraviense TaxID=2738409 RepID=UPI001E4CA918|nr:hypothetical protein [Mycobacterium ostraviense]UGT93091.1 hypothetical protein LTS72_07165 [Mycobacterium ostraviense]